MTLLPGSSPSSFPKGRVGVLAQNRIRAHLSVWDVASLALRCCPQRSRQYPLLGLGQQQDGQSRQHAGDQSPTQPSVVFLARGTASPRCARTPLVPGRCRWRRELLRGESSRGGPRVVESPLRLAFVSQLRPTYCQNLEGQGPPLENHQTGHHP